ncbi:MAG TPA: HEAT repeat domain-containing protein [Candidatus Dormibacteraeota bacterium]
MNSGPGLIGGARKALARNRFRWRLEAVIAGSATAAPLEPGLEPDDLLAALLEAAVSASSEMGARLRLLNGVASGPLRDLLYQRFGEDEPARRVPAMQIAGLLGMGECIPLLARAAAGTDATVREAAARALGRIGGAGAADALVRAIRWRRESAVRLTLELARAAPVLYLERALLDLEFAPVRGWLALAAGLRRRPSAVASLVHVLATGSRFERIAACRALGWIGDPSVLPAIGYLLKDPGWQVRWAAARALGQIGEPGCLAELEENLQDRNLKVRVGTAGAIARLTQATTSEPLQVAAWR